MGSNELFKKRFNELDFLTEEVKKLNIEQLLDKERELQKSFSQAEMGLIVQPNNPDAPFEKSAFKVQLDMVRDAIKRKQDQETQERMFAQSKENIQATTQMAQEIKRMADNTEKVVEDSRKRYWLFTLQEWLVIAAITGVIIAIVSAGIAGSSAKTAVQSLNEQKMLNKPKTTFAVDSLSLIHI